MPVMKYGDVTKATSTVEGSTVSTNVDKLSALAKKYPLLTRAELEQLLLDDTALQTEE